MTYERTVCACDDCRACCKRQPGPLVPGDLTRIREALGLTPDAARGLFVASPGAVVANRETGRVFRIPTITPARKADGSCVFLDDQERCTIHAVAPAGCAYFDTHMGQEEADERARWACVLQQDSGYQEIRRTLPKAEEPR